VFVAAAGAAALQAGGDTRTPLVIGASANVVHVAFNRVLILGAWGVPAMGARGAGVSTAVTFGLEAILVILALASPRRPVSWRAATSTSTTTSTNTSTSTSTSGEARELARIGGPAFAERVLYHVGILGYTLLITRLGDAVMAANQSLISVESTCF